MQLGMYEVYSTGTEVVHIALICLNVFSPLHRWISWFIPTSCFGELLVIIPTNRGEFLVILVIFSDLPLKNVIAM